MNRQEKWMGCTMEEVEVVCAVLITGPQVVR